MEAQMSDRTWRIEGDYFESCNCDLLCPCLLSHAQARPTQGAALEAIFTGNAGGPPSLMSGMIATRLPTRSAQINFSSDGKKFSISIPGITEVTVEGVIGIRNQVVWLENVSHPFSQRLAAAKGTQSHFADHSLIFDNSGRNGHVSPISWSNG
jgi:hypothetical protein